MKRRRLAGLLLVPLLGGCAPHYAVITPIAERPAERPVLVVGDVEDGLAPEIPSTEHPSRVLLARVRAILADDLLSLVLETKTEGKPFADVVLALPDSNGRNLLLTAKILKYRRGSRAGQLLVGLGIGHSEAIVRITIREIDSGREVFCANFKGVGADPFRDLDSETFHSIGRDLAKALRQSWSE